MAFSRYRPELRPRHHHLSGKHSNSNAGGTSSVHSPQPYSSNLTRQLTGGMQQLYKRIANLEQSKLLARSQPISNNVDSTPSFTRADGHLIISDKLPLLHNRYSIVSTIGEGTFSQLVLAEDTFSPLPTQPGPQQQRRFPSTTPPPPPPTSAHKRIAIKIMNCKYAFIGLQEVEKLCWLNGRDPRNESHIVRLLGAFYFHSHLCLVMELCGQSLLSYMKMQPFHRVTIDVIRKIAFQLCLSLAFVGSCNMIHGDIKPENVLLTHPSPGTSSHVDGDSSSQSSNTKSIRLIDFGNAMTGNEALLYFDDFDVQTLYYRAPEVVLGVSFNSAIDMWSLGCVLMELATGKPLFHCTSNKELFLSMIKILGPMPLHAFINGKFVKKYFTQPNFSYTPSSVSSSPSQTALPMSNTSQPPPVSHTDSSHYHYLARLNSISKMSHSRDRDFVSFVCSLLEYDPKQRLTPFQALFHPFFGKLTPLSLILGNPSDCMNALVQVQRHNTKQSVNPQFQHHHQQQLQSQMQSQIPHHQISDPAAITPGSQWSSVIQYNPSRSTPTFGSPIMPVYQSIPTMQHSPAFSPQATSPHFSPTYSLSNHRRLHAVDPQTPMSSQSQDVQTFYYPQALSSFSHNLSQPSTPILAARPPPAMPPRFPNSPDTHNHYLYPNNHTMSNAIPTASTAPAYTVTSPHHSQSFVPISTFAPPNYLSRSESWSHYSPTQQQLQPHQSLKHIQAQAALVQSSVVEYAQSDNYNRPSAAYQTAARQRSTPQTISTNSNSVYALQVPRGTQAFAYPSPPSGNEKLSGDSNSSQRKRKLSVDVKLNKRLNNAELRELQALDDGNGYNDHDFRHDNQLTYYSQIAPSISEGIVLDDIRHLQTNTMPQLTAIPPTVSARIGESYPPNN